MKSKHSGGPMGISGTVMDSQCYPTLSQGCWAFVFPHCLITEYRLGEDTLFG